MISLMIQMRYVDAVLFLIIYIPWTIYAIKDWHRNGAWNDVGDMTNGWTVFTIAAVIITLVGLSINYW
jgi:hypothetical protein